MEIDDLTIGQAKQLACLLRGQGGMAKPDCCPFIGKRVLVRTYSAGIHFGTLSCVSGTEVLLTDSRRIWSWTGAFTLTELSQRGIADGLISSVVPQIYLSEAIEVMPLSDAANVSLTNWKEYRP